MLSRIMHKGSGGAGLARHSFLNNCLAVSTVAAAIDKLWAVPVFLRAGTLDRIGFEVTGAGGAGNKARVALFTNKGDTLAYPDKWLTGFQTTEADGTATGVKETASLSQVVDDGWYWLTYVNGAGTVCTVRAAAVGGIDSVLGLTSTPTPITGVSVAKTYDADGFADMTTGGTTFPTGGAYETAAMPLMWVAYSS